MVKILQISQDLTESFASESKTIESNGSVSSSKTVKEDVQVQVVASPIVQQAALKEENSNAGKKSPELEVKAELDIEDMIDMSGELTIKYKR